MDHLAVGPAPEAGPELTGLGEIVALDPDDSVIFNMQSEGTSATAVEGGCGPDNSHPPAADIQVGSFDVFHCLLQIYMG